MLVSRRKVRIEWGDCDPAGIVYFPRYFQHFDNATVALFEKATGLKKIEMVQKHQTAGIPMVNIRARFIIPARYGDDVTIESEITEFRRSSFDVLHRLLHGKELAAECTETRVWTVHDPKHPGELKSAPIPEAIKGRFTGAKTNAKAKRARSAN
jgi:4-hydroxybenzoyl-CoA thioesterase